MTLHFYRQEPNKVYAELTGDDFHNGELKLLAAFLEAELLKTPPGFSFNRQRTAGTMLPNGQVEARFILAYQPGDTVEAIQKMCAAPMAGLRYQFDELIKAAKAAEIIQKISAQALEGKTA